MGSRIAQPRDYERIIEVVDYWWGRPVQASLPRAVTAPGNHGSIRFHQRLGFDVSAPVPDYNGAGRSKVIFTRIL